MMSKHQSDLNPCNLSTVTLENCRPTRRLFPRLRWKRRLFYGYAGSHTLATLLFRWTRYGRCPACGRWSRFSVAVPAATGVPPEMQHLVPWIAKCQRNGCTSSVLRLERRAIPSLELRTAAREA
jgi:hypothetical protein